MSDLDLIFPPDYWREADEMAALQLVHHDAIGACAIIRCYVGQEGAIVARRLFLTIDVVEAEAMLDHLHRLLTRSLEDAAARAGLPRREKP